MTINEEADSIRAEVESLRRGPGRKYSDELRERVESWMSRANADGVREHQWERSLGIRHAVLARWREEARYAAAAENY
ncbi:MAG TPA: hypothetical protein VGM39_04990 [Kofleriaceae bacterium]|jgi:hypothetical protein